MKTTIITILITFLTAASALADRQAEAEARHLRRTGGSCEKPGKGFVAIINAQSLVPLATIKAGADALRRQTRLDFRIVANEAEAKDGGLVIRLVSEENQPPMLASPETGWAQVNVRALGEDLKTDSARAKFLPLRAQKMLTRAFAYAAGVGGTGYAKNLFDTVTLRDIDYYDNVLPVDVCVHAIEHVSRRGIIPSEEKSYVQACREGWAPAPTNDIQKAVWEKVHAIPNKPLKIEFNPKTDAK